MDEYISREAAYREIMALTLIPHISPIASAGVQKAAHVVHEIPSADVAPVRHGRWVVEEKDFGFAPCSLCGEIHEVDAEPINYCPNCGAKMDGRTGEPMSKMDIEEGGSDNG